MRKTIVRGILVAVAATFIWAGAIFAQQRATLECDVATVPIDTVEVEVTHNGVTTVQIGTYIVTPDGTIELLDLTNFPNGNFTFRARWGNADQNGDVWFSNWSTDLDVVHAGSPKNKKVKVK